ncbi:unnamed protein product [Vitrella brassicaformis CCMP3155]|uniref:Uncharacterized protein n=2 Tax=Vitrella brassicaformis TaxID=1169539 RepID=A0A0G4G077_VITBC|nr:unnamed protein product [Vitrella brassicaformis CCMP3155]|eukprot:CEM21250.1 unnamed protein product [Vitrella brassicaformis CCMP3155]
MHRRLTLIGSKILPLSHPPPCLPQQSAAFSLGIWPSRRTSSKETEAAKSNPAATAAAGGADKKDDKTTAKAQPAAPAAAAPAAEAKKAEVDKVKAAPPPPPRPSAAAPAKGPTPKPAPVVRREPGPFARLRSFLSGVIVSSAVGFYVFYFHMWDANLELSVLVKDVAKRQALIEKRLTELEKAD